MGSRLLLSSIIVLVAFGTSAESRADGVWPRHHARAHHGARHYPRYCCHVGGYRYWYQHTPFTFTDANNYPGYYNNQTFWERVQTQRNYPVQY